MDNSHARVNGSSRSLPTSEGFLSPRANSKPAQNYREAKGAGKWMVSEYKDFPQARHREYLIGGPKFRSGLDSR